MIAAALRTGELEREEVEGETYLWPTSEGDWREHAVPRDVRLLTPFDPLVWDRRRFVAPSRPTTRSSPNVIALK